MTSQSFSNFEQICSLKANDERIKAWLKDYEGLYFSVGENSKDLIYWEREKEKYIYRVGQPLEIQCLDGKFRILNKIQRHPSRIVVEFDDKEPNSAKKDKAQIERNTEKAIKFAEKQGWGFIQSNHKGMGDYLWFEFSRALSSNEARQFLIWFAEKIGDCEIDLNFANDKFRLPVLFAEHWKYGYKEKPIAFSDGKKIDFDSLGISVKKIKSKITRTQNGYSTFETQEFQSDTKKYESQGIKEFLNYPEEKDKPIVKKFFAEKDISVIYGQPASCKSLFVNNLACCVATGKKFLGIYPTRKTAVLILSAENPEQTDRNRFRAILRGMGISYKRRKPKNLQLFYSGRDNIDVLSSPDYYPALKEIIEKNKIGLLIIDTLSPLILDTNDNLASDIVNVFKNRLFPLIKEFGISIILTLHSQKTGKDFLGSVKLKASADTFYELDRSGDNELALLCQKNRLGEHSLKMQIEFLEKKEKLHQVNFRFLEEMAGIQSNKKGRSELPSVEAEKIILSALENKELPYKEMVDACKEEGITLSTARRTISKLYKSKKIKKNPGKEGGYYLP